MVLATSSSDRTGLVHFLKRVFGLYLSLGAVQVLLRLVRAYLLTRRAQRMLRDVPHQRSGSGLAVLQEMLKNWRRIHHWRDEVTRGFPISKIHGLPFVPCFVTVRDPACVKHFLKDNFNAYSKPLDGHDDIVYYFKEWLGEGIFSALHGSGAPDGGKSWSLQRKIAANIFKRSNFTGLMNEVFVKKAARMTDCLEGMASDRKQVDMQKMFFNLTLDGVMEIFFGEACDTVGGDTSEYGKAYDGAHYAMIEYIMQSAAFNLLSKLFLPWPFGGYSGLAWRMNEYASPLYQQFRHANAILDKESFRLIKQCRADPKLHERRDLLALFLQAQEKERFSNKFLRDVVLSFVIAGRDTTACTLSWMFYILATNPEAQAKLCEEVDRCLPSSGVTFDSISPSKMPYLHGVLYETLRLYPPVPFDFKECHEDDTMPDGSRIPKGSMVGFLPYAMGRDADVYPEPEKVKPERWIPFVAPAPHEFPVFQAGPRICLGMDMAIFEAKIAAATLLKRYTFEMAPGEAEKISYGRKVTMSVNNDKDQPEESENLWLIPHQRH